MKIEDLIELAKTRSGMNLGEMARELEIPQSKFTAWKKGQYKPGTSEIMYLADKAGLRMMETVAEIETQSHPAFGRIWRKAIEQSMPKSLFHHFFQQRPQYGAILAPFRMVWVKSLTNHPTHCPATNTHIPCNAGASRTSGKPF